ncbi:MAG: ZIP family metal transporter [Candidatus Ranarchaeia archaeon]
MLQIIEMFLNMYGGIIGGIILSFLAGICTILGALIVIVRKKSSVKELGFILGFGGGVILFVSFVDLLPSTIETLMQPLAFLIFFIGMGIGWLIDLVVPHEHQEGLVDEGVLQINRSSIITAMGIAIHNFPEGIIVFFASMKNITFAIPIMIAIAIHNIPEGMLVAGPMCHTDGGKKKPLILATIAGLAEPLGALMAAILLFPIFVQFPFIIDIAMAFVAGLMVYIAVEELLPIAERECGGHPVAAGVMIGMIIMAISLVLFAI